MRVTFVIPGLNMSGGTRVVAIYADMLARKGHTVTVIAPKARPASIRQAVKAILGLQWPFGKRTDGQSYFGGTGASVRVLDHPGPVVQSDVPDADVIVATWWETAEWIRDFESCKGAKVYFIQHHEVFDHLPKERCQATYRLPFHQIVVAKWLHLLMQREYGRRQVDLVPNAIDHEQFYAAERSKQPEPTVGLLYSTHRFKGVDVSLAAIQRAKSNIPNIRIVAFGADPESPTLPLPQGASFRVLPSQSELRGIYSKCDVWLTASTSEGFNLPAMEAMACGTPVVSTRAGWPNEAIVSGMNGWLAEVGNIEQLASGLEWALCMSAEEWLSISRNCVATVASCSWEQSCDSFEKALLSAIYKTDT